MFLRRILTLLVPLIAITACSESSSTDLDDPEVSTLLVDAKDSWGYVSFDGDLATQINVTDPSGSSDWHMALYATSVMLNGGAAGPGGVEGYCVCQNDDATDEQITFMSAEEELADFEAVTAGDIPADEEAWSVDALVPAIDGWYSYDVQTNTVSAAPGTSFYVRTAAGDAYAKLHVTEIVDAAQQHAGQVTLEFANWTGQAFGDAQTLVVDLASGPVYVDLESGTSSASATAGWDLRLEGYDIHVNGGASGDGQAGAGATDTPFEEIDGLPPTDAAYSADAFGGVFDDHAWYRYNLEGGHQIWPTFDVYLIRTGDAVYKIQIISYYHPDGRDDDTRYITFRYELLEG